MEKKLDNADKKEYLSPALIEYGTLNSITKHGGPGIHFDEFTNETETFSNEAV